METTNTNIASKQKFYAIGLNYKKADAKIRGLFSLDKNRQTQLLLEAKKNNIPSLSVLSTCNRTEIYGRAENPFLLIKLLCKYTEGSLEQFDEIGYVHTERDAIRHIFKVGTGLDSQILGDFEIISQLRESFSQSKEVDMLDTFMERLINEVIHASKRIKNETQLSSGATSVSYATVQYLMSQVPDISQKKILLFGVGEIGRNTVENLVKHSHHSIISVINRTTINAEKIARKFELEVYPIEALNEQISQTDVLIVATGAQKPTIGLENLEGLQKEVLVIDLSIPQNVDPAVDRLSKVKRIHLDELTQITQDTLEQRKLQIPLALTIIGEVEEDFIKWLNIRKFSPMIRALKERFDTIKNEEIDYQSKKLDGFNKDQAEVLGSRITQKIVKHFASFLREENTATEDTLQLISKVFHLELKNLEN